MGAKRKQQLFLIYNKKNNLKSICVYNMGAEGGSRSGTR
jgi:hypothetical protein